jgi:DNA-binding NtrC family response regulator
MNHTIPQVNNGGEVWIVDDCRDTLEIMEVMLTLCGYTVVAAHSMEHALRMFSRREKAAVLVTDYYLGDGTGKDLVTRLGTQCPEVCVLISGGANIPKDGFDAFMAKPVDPITLPEVLSRLLNREVKVA